MLKNIRYWLIKVAGVSKTEANAMLILIPAIFLFAIVPGVVIDSFKQEYNPEQDQLILDSLLATLNKANVTTTDASHTMQITTYSPSVFDPNTASQETLTSNGFPAFLAQRIINYRSKGGKFRTKQDLLKIYGFNDSLYTIVESYVSINAKATSSYIKRDSSFSKTNYAKKEYAVRSFDLNVGDTSDYKQIKGIGSKLSVRIINFRDKLGGFHNISQLYEVWGLSTEVVDELLKHGYLSNEYPTRKINVNSDSIKHLLSHPYISYKAATAIIRYRQQHGNYIEIDQLKNIHLIDDSLYLKILPYLKIDK